MQMKYELPNAANPTSPLRKFVTFLFTLAVFGLVLMFSAVLFSVILIFGLIAWAFLWWKTRKLRKQMRDFPFEQVVQEQEMQEGNVYEGEVIHVDVDQRTR